MIDVNQPVSSYLIVALCAVCFGTIIRMGFLNLRIKKLESQIVEVKKQVEQPTKN